MKWLLFLFAITFTSHACAANASVYSTDKADSIFLKLDQETLRDVEVVGLGEATHGGHEPFIFKTEAIKYLVEKRGFRNILFEFTDMSLRSLNAYLQSDQAFDTQVIDTLFKHATDESIIYCREFRALFYWLKNYNLSHSQYKVTIKGIDIFTDFYYMRDNYIDSSAYAQIKAKYRGKKISVTEQDNILREWYKLNEPSLRKTLTDEKLKQLTEDLNNSAANAYCLQHGGTRNRAMVTYRDSVMTNNAVNAMHGKTIIWAHNLHLNNTGFNVYQFHAKNLGMYLKKIYGSRMLTILTDFTGTASVYTFDNNKVGKTRITSVNNSLGRLCGKIDYMNDRLLDRTEINSHNLPFDSNSISVEGRGLLLSGSQDSYDYIMVFKTIRPSELLY